MFCPKCGKINPDENEICSGCSATLHEEKKEENNTKKGKVLKTVLVALAVVVLVCVVVMLLNGCGISSIPEEKMSF